MLYMKRLGQMNSRWNTTCRCLCRVVSCRVVSKERSIINDQRPYSQPSRPRLERLERIRVAETHARLC